MRTFLNERFLANILVLIAFVLTLSATGYSQDIGNQSEVPSHLGVMRNTIVQTHKLLEEHWQKLSPATKTASYLMRITPFYSWIVLCTAIEKENFAFLLDSCLEEEGGALYDKWASMSQDQMVADYSGILTSLWKKNPLDAVKFAKAVLGEARDVRFNEKVFSIVQLAALLYVVVALRRLISSWTKQDWVRCAKWTFLASSLIWLAGFVVFSIAISSVVNDFDSFIFLLNFHTIVVDGFGTLSIILGAGLLARWIWLRKKLRSNQTKRP